VPAGFDSPARIVSDMPPDYRDRSFWFEDAGDDLAPRPPLSGSADVDVAIVGAGYTGLWTAYYLAAADPALRIAIVEQEIAGFGASGRNGGWCSALFSAPREELARGPEGRAGAVAMQRAMFATIDEVGKVADAEGIEAHFFKGGTITAATSPAHVERIKASVDEDHAWGFGPEDSLWLERTRAQAELRVAGSLGAAYTPHCAALQPARLVRGLARVVDAKGVALYEGTRAAKIERGVVTTPGGRLRADVVVRATEGYTAQLPGLGRALLPLYSLMIATEPLPPAVWDKIGWRRRETFSDGRHLLIYAQRTADDRIAMGGRGAPYHFRSRTSDSFEFVPHVFNDLEHVLKTLWPAAREARITHRWGGPLAVPRDWYSSVGLDRRAKLAWGGGYVGDGVATANLAGRTIADLILARDTDITKLPWVGHSSRRWEPEPLRVAGVNLARLTMASADRQEDRTGRPSRRAELVARLTGIH
jgi:glycine/D-amino acid oxidase-like deaminating enzyme